MSNGVRWPNACANCGGDDPSSWWNVTSTGRTVFLVVCLYSTQYRLSFPICERCRTELERRGLIHKIQAAAFCGVAAMALGAGIAGVEGAFLGIGGALVGVVIGHYTRPGHDMGTYDGTYFEFNNPQFHSKFADLNPTLVRKR
jgi:hypothetical protein